MPISINNSHSSKLILIKSTTDTPSYTSPQPLIEHQIYAAPYPWPATSAQSPRGPVTSHRGVWRLAVTSRQSPRRDGRAGADRAVQLLCCPGDAMRVFIRHVHEHGARAKWLAPILRLAAAKTGCVASRAYPHGDDRPRFLPQNRTNRVAEKSKSSDLRQKWKGSM